MSKKTTVIKFSLRVALGLSALLLSMGFSGPALASCEAFPKNPLWKTLTHDFARQHVDRKYDGDWQAYIKNLVGYESQLRGIYKRGSAAVVTWKNEKIQIKGAAIDKFLKDVMRRISVTRCLAYTEDVANFSTAAGGTDGQASDEPGPAQCAPIPKVDWWKFKTHETISGFVSRKYRGNWGKYIDSWNRRFDKLQNIHNRGASAVTNTGVTLRGADLADYMAKMQKRISVTRCLAARSGNSRI